MSAWRLGVLALLLGATAALAAPSAGKPLRTPRKGDPVGVGPRGSSNGPLRKKIVAKLDPETLAERQHAAGLHHGNMLLAQGHFRLAIEAFLAVLNNHPDDAEAHIGLGTARARLGRCGLALDEFMNWDTARAFGPRSALLAARCASDEQDYGTAVAYDLHAQQRRPADLTALGRLALDASRLGDTVLSDMAREYLWYVNPEQDESLYVDAALALRRGDLDEFDVIVALWRHEGRPEAELLRLEAQAWMDVGDPESARATMLSYPKLRRGSEARLILSEATRRSGYPSEARQVLDNKLVVRLIGADADSIRARTLIDEGDLPGATELLADYADETSQEVVAARWYLAKARGDTAAMAVEAAQFETVRESPRQTLEQYLPVVKVTTR